MLEFIKALDDMPIQFWYVVGPSILLVIFSLGYLMYGYFRKRTDDERFYDNWKEYIDHELSEVRKHPRVGRINHYSQCFHRLHTELRDATGSYPNDFILMPTAKLSIWIYLLERQRGIFYFHKR